MSTHSPFGYWQPQPEDYMQEQTSVERDFSLEDLIHRRVMSIIELRTERLQLQKDLAFPFAAEEDFSQYFSSLLQ